MLDQATLPILDAEAELQARMAPVRAWSRKVFGPRDTWALDTARAILTGADLPPWPGRNQDKGERLRDVVRRLLDEGQDR